jgi:hypothetical protein
MADNADVEAQSLVREAQQRVAAVRAERLAKRPQSAAQGVRQGLLSLAGGIATAGAGLLVAPVASTYSAPKGKKLQGAVGGIAAGVGIFVAAPIVGAVRGTGQVISGARAGMAKKPPPPEPTGAYEQVPYPDSASAEDIQRALAEDRAAYLSERAALYRGMVLDEAPDAGPGSAATRLSAGGPSGLPPPKETGLYDVLRIDPSATNSDIKRAYHKRSLATHPDRTGSDGEEFKLIGEAYQVLSDPEKRLEYHRQGTVASAETLISPEVLFSLMLMPKGFKPLIGDAAQAALLATLPPTAGEAAEAHVAGALAEFNGRRVAELAALLALRIAPFVEGRIAEFTSFAEREAVMLSAEPLGTDLLHTVGYAYSSKARHFLAGGSAIPLKGFFSELSDGATVLKKQLQAAVDVRSMQVSDRKGEKDDSVDEAERRRAVTGLSAVFLSQQVDISTILREVVETVCSDPSQPKDVLHRRAQAISALGAIFSAA